MISIKPVYQNDDIEVYWDIPEYTGRPNENE